MSKAERTRQFIIERAAPIINKKGMAATSISDIMVATRLAKGGIYGNFETKDEICAEAFDYLMEKLSSAIESRIAIKKTNKEKLFELLDFHVGLFGKDTNYGCPMLNFGAEADDTDPLVKQKVGKAITNSENRIAKIIKSGIEAGEFDKQFDPSQFAIKAFAMLEGAILISKVQHNNRQMRIITDILKAEIIANCK